MKAFIFYISLAIAVGYALANIGTAKIEQGTNARTAALANT